MQTQIDKMFRLIIRYSERFKCKFLRNKTITIYRGKYSKFWGKWGNFTRWATSSWGKYSKFWGKWENFSKWASNGNEATSSSNSLEKESSDQILYKKYWWNVVMKYSRFCSFPLSLYSTIFSEVRCTKFIKSAVYLQVNLC